MKSKTFTEPLFRAAVDGTKTQFREIVKPQPDSDMPVPDEGFVNYDETCGRLCGKQRFYDMGTKNMDYDILYFPVKPRYAIGETVYFKEPYCQDCKFVQHEYSREWIANGKYRYKYAGDKISEFARDSHGFGRWKNAIAMSKSAARYFIQITAVKCERVQDISEEDCIREGIVKCKNGVYCFMQFMDIKPECHPSAWIPNPKQAFAALFDHLHGKGAWEANPYCFCYEFKLIKKEVVYASTR
jgi:hypothetical protein